MRLEGKIKGVILRLRIEINDKRPLLSQNDIEDPDFNDFDLPWGDDLDSSDFE